MSGLLDRYPGSPRDEAVSPSGGLRGGYGDLAPLLDRLGEDGLATAAAALTDERRDRGVLVGSWADGRQWVRPLPMDPVPRIVGAESWARLSAGVAQRHRALNAFLADVYRAAGRRRGDPDRAPDIVRAGVLPEWSVVRHPSRDPGAVGRAWRGQPRATVAGTDVVGTAAGSWTVVADNLRVPSGLGFALANRDSARAAVPGLFAGDRRRPVDPWDAVPLLRQALVDAAPPAVTGPPRIAILSAGDSDRAEFEHRLLAEALDVPLVHAGDLWPRIDGGLWAATGRERYPVDVLYRRFDDAELGAHPTPAGRALHDLLTDAVRAGRLGLANVPGNAIGDDAATYAAVPDMIRFYLGETPLLASVPTWVLADQTHWKQVSERLHELVLRPVDGYGGSDVVVGPACSSAELAQLQAEVAAAPHRFVAQEPVDATTVPTLVDGVLQPRRAGLRVFSVAGTGTAVLPAPLTRVAVDEGEEHAPHRGSSTKDTWLL